MSDFEIIFIPGQGTGIDAFQLLAARLADIANNLDLPQCERDAAHLLLQKYNNEIPDSYKQLELEVKGDVVSTSTD